MRFTVLVARCEATDCTESALPVRCSGRTDTFAAYKLKLQYPVTLQVNLKNIFDKSYYTSSIATNNLGNQIGDPREVQFTVKMDF